MILVLVVTGADILLVLFVMQMTLFCWLPLLRPSDICCIFVSHLHPLMGCCSMPAKLSSSVFIHRVQLSNILPSSLTTPSCTILTVLCIWVTYSPLTWMIGRILSESSKILIVKPILFSANFMLLTPSSNVILLNLTVYLCMEPHYGLCRLLHYTSLKLLLTKFYAKLGTLVIGHTLESPIALREFLLSVILFLTVSVPSSHVLFLLLTLFKIYFY